jgi:hypothetical protein
MNDEDQPALDAQLARLPSPIQDPTVAARSQRRARALFLAQHRAAEFPVLGRLWRLYLGAEPILVASIAVIYLGWAWGTLASLWR